MCAQIYKLNIFAVLQAEFYSNDIYPSISVDERRVALIFLSLFVNVEKALINALGSCFQYDYLDYVFDSLNN